jgi:hypothetical protein
VIAGQEIKEFQSRFKFPFSRTRFNGKQNSGIAVSISLQVVSLSDKTK